MANLKSPADPNAHMAEAPRAPRNRTVIDIPEMAADKFIGDPVELDYTLVNDPVALVDDPEALVGGPVDIATIPSIAMARRDSRVTDAQSDSEQSMPHDSVRISSPSITNTPSGNISKDSARPAGVVVSDSKGRVYEPIPRGITNI